MTMLSLESALGLVAASPKKIATHMLRRSYYAADLSPGLVSHICKKQVFSDMAHIAVELLVEKVLIERKSCRV